MLASALWRQFATVPPESSRALVATPSPLTSRVIEGFSSFLRSYDLVDVDNSGCAFCTSPSAACSSFKIIFSTSSPTFPLPSGVCVHNRETAHPAARQCLRQSVLPVPVGPTARCGLLSSTSPGCYSKRSACSGCNRHPAIFLVRLPNHVAVEELLDLRRAGKSSRRRGGLARASRLQDRFGIRPRTRSDICARIVRSELISFSTCPAFMAKGTA